MTDKVKVTITFSDWYTVIGGGWTGLRPQGRRRDYRADVLGRGICKTSKAEIESAVRTVLNSENGWKRVPVEFVYVHE